MALVYLSSLFALAAMKSVYQKKFINNDLLQQKQIVTSAEEKLYDYLFGDNTYSKEVGPVSSDGKLRINIDLELELMGVISVDKDENLVTFKAALRQWWYDPRLKWDAANFSNVTRIHVSHEQLWVPDTVIREDAGDGFLSDFKLTPIRLYNTGINYWTRLG